LSKMASASRVAGMFAPCRITSLEQRWHSGRAHPAGQPEPARRIPSSTAHPEVAAGLRKLVQLPDD
jgi:hypothetical protein